MKYFVQFALSAKSPAYVAGGIRERPSGRAPIFRRSPRRNSRAPSTRLFISPLTASPLAFRGFTTKTKALAREIPPATQATKNHVLRVFPCWFAQLVWRSSVESADEFAQEAEDTGKLVWITKANSLRKSTKVKENVKCCGWTKKDRLLPVY